MVRDDEIERIAVEAAIAYEEARGWQVESVENENRGFDLISRRPHPEDPQTCIEVRFIEVKGRAGVGEMALTTNEYKTAERLEEGLLALRRLQLRSTPELHTIQDPARLGWEPIVKVEHYQVTARVHHRGCEVAERSTYPKRLIEVDLPIKRISAHARREKSIRHGNLDAAHLVGYGGHWRPAVR